MSDKKPSQMTISLLPGGIDGELYMSDRLSNQPLPLKHIKTVVPSARLGLFMSEPVQQYVTHVTLRYGQAYLLPTEIAQTLILPRLFAGDSNSLRTKVARRLEEGVSTPFRIQPTAQKDGDQASLTQDLPLSKILACLRYASDPEETREGGNVAIDKKKTKFLHWRKGCWSLVYVREPSKDDPTGTIILLSRHLVMTIIASYALALVGPHRKWVEALRRRAP